MKMPQLHWILAALLVVVPAALAAIESPLPNLESGARRRFCPGCYSSILQVPIPEVESGLARRPCPGCFSALFEGETPQPSPTLGSTMALLEYIKRQTSLEDSVLEIPGLQAERRRPRTPCVGCFEPLDTSKVALRAKREERKVASGRRLRKLPGTRPVCRGCFSGLMLTGRPAEGGAGGTSPKSLSASGEVSSEGD